MAKDRIQQPPYERKTKKINEIIDEALAIEAEEAANAGASSYMARALVQATLPHSQQQGNEFTRVNGAFRLSLLAPSEIGLPYGSIPRLLVGFLTTRAFVTKCREIDLGRSLAAYMSELKEVPTGGRWGTINRVEDQTKRLFSTSIICSYTAKEKKNRGYLGLNLSVADKCELWWDPQSPTQITTVGSYVRLSERFFDEVINNPVPVNMRAMRWLKKSPLALDIYTWLTYRMSYLSKPTVIPWEALQMQFGADYTRPRDFRAAFLARLQDVLCLYPAKVAPVDAGLELRPSKTHVPKGRG